MSKFRVLTPKVQASRRRRRYGYEQEALDPIDAEIIRAPPMRRNSSKPPRRGRHLRQGLRISKKIIDALQNCK